MSAKSWGAGAERPCCGIWAIDFPSYDTKSTATLEEVQRVSNGYSIYASTPAVQARIAQLIRETLSSRGIGVIDAKDYSTPYDATLGYACSGFRVHLFDTKLIPLETSVQPSPQRLEIEVAAQGYARAAIRALRNSDTPEALANAIEDEPAQAWMAAHGCSSLSVPRQLRRAEEALRNSASPFTAAVAKRTRELIQQAGFAVDQLRGNGRGLTAEPPRWRQVLRGWI